MTNKKYMLDPSKAFYEIAFDSLGVYPEYIIKEGVKSERTKWQEGWNAFGTQFLDRVDTFMSWFETLTETQQDAFMNLHNIENIIWMKELIDCSVQVYLNANDVFYYACGDVEEIYPEQFEQVLYMYNTYGHSGVIAWMAKQRNSEPIKPWLSEDYYKAYDYLNNN